MTNQYIPSSIAYVHEMPPSLSPQELLNVKKSLVQHSGFMTDKTLLNDLLCSLDRKLQIHHVSESYPITSLAVGASGRLSPRVMDGTNTLFGPVRNGSSLTVQPSEALPSFPSREHERITGTPLKIGKRPAWNSAAFQKRLSSTPTSKILPQASLGGKPTVVRSLNDSLSFSEISSPQSCYASPLRVFSGGEICQQNSTSSKETFPKETSTSDIEKNNANGEKHFKMALSCDTLQPIQSDHLVGSDSVLLNHRFTHSNGGREADRLHEIHASDPRHERKISNEQNSEVDRALQNCNSFGIVPPPVQYASLKQVTFVSHPDILSSSAADISEVSEHCTVDSQATISGPSLVSEVAKTDPPFEQFNGDSIVQRQLSIEPTGSATPGNDSVLCEAKKLKANHESDGQCSRNTVVLQLQASEPLDKKTHNEVMKNDKQLFCTNIVTSDSSVEKDLLAFAQDSLQANMPVTASSMSSEANGYNNASHTKSHYNLGSVDAGETTDFHTDETHTKSRYNFGSLDTKETVDFPADETAVNTVGTRVAESDGTAGTPKQISGLNLVPKNEATHRSCGSCEAGNSYRTADSSQTGINYESTCTRRYERTPEAADASNICEDGNRELEEALQHEKERCQFLLASLVKMEEQYLRAEREKRHALAAVAALEEKQKSLLDLHCCGVRMKFPEMRTYNWSLDFSSSQWSQLLPQSSASSFKNHPTSQEYEDLPRPTHLTDTNGKDYLRFGDLDLGSHQEVVKYPNDTKELENTKFKDVRLELPEEVGAAFTGTIFSDESSHLKCTTTTNVRTSNCNFNSEALNENHNPRLSKDKSVSRMSEERSMHFEITREQEVLTTQSGDQLEEVSKVLGGDCAVACDKELPTVLYTCLNKDANEAPNSLNTTSDQSNLVSSDYAPKYSNPIHDRTNPAVINSNSVFQSSNPPLIGFCGIPNDAQDAVSISPAHVTESREAPLPATLGLPSSDSDSDLDSPSSSCYYDFSNNDGNETVRGKLSARSDANHGNHSGGTGHNDSCDADHEGVHDFLQVNSRLCNQYFRDSYGHFRELQNGNTAPDDKFTSGNCDNENPENFSLQVVCNGLTRVDTAGACNEVDNCTDSPSDCFVHDFRSVPEFDDHSEDQSYQKKDTEMRSFDKRQSHALAQNFRLQLLECSNLETNEEISTERPMRTPSSVIFSDEISKSLPCSLNRAVPCVSIEAPVVIEKILQTVRPFGADDCARKSEVHVSAIKSHEGNCEVPFDRFKGQSFAASPVAGTASNNQDLRAAEASVVVTSDGVPIIVSESCSSIKPWSLPVLKKPSIVAGVDATSTKPKSSVAGMTFNSNKSASHRTKGPTKKALAGGSNKTLEGGSNKELAGGSQKVLGARDSYGKYTSASKILLALDEEKAVLLEELRKLTVSEKSMLHHDKPRPRMELNQHEPNPSEDAVQLRGCSRPASLDPAHPTDPKATTNPTAAPVTVAADPAAAPVLRGTGSLHCYSFITDVPTRDTTDGDEY